MAGYESKCRSCGAIVGFRYAGNAYINLDVLTWRCPVCTELNPHIPDPNYGVPADGTASPGEVESAPGSTCEGDGKPFVAKAGFSTDPLPCKCALCGRVFTVPQNFPANMVFCPDCVLTGSAAMKLDECRIDLPMGMTWRNARGCALCGECYLVPEKASLIERICCARCVERFEAVSRKPSTEPAGDGVERDSSGAPICRRCRNGVEQTNHGLCLPCVEACDDEADSQVESATDLYREIVSKLNSKHVNPSSESVAEIFGVLWPLEAKRNGW